MPSWSNPEAERLVETLKAIAHEGPIGSDPIRRDEMSDGMPCAHSSCSAMDIYIASLFACLPVCLPVCLSASHRSACLLPACPPVSFLCSCNDLSSLLILFYSLSLLLHSARSQQMNFNLPSSAKPDLFVLCANEQALATATQVRNT